MKWNDLPVEIQERMLECQEEQGNTRDPKVFKDDIFANRATGGFNWIEANEGEAFWIPIISEENIYHFYTKYPIRHKYSARIIAESESDLLKRIELLEQEIQTIKTQLK